MHAEKVHLKLGICVYYLSMFILEMNASFSISVYDLFSHIFKPFSSSTFFTVKFIRIYIII